ncbi:carboxymuconolactone decarboxylase family protein [Natronospirillum operosum]|uniref:Carboxymuconolactone decarboxylase family protein n=1 Tax=Natronospirillum operosum TaxID=2759953 RepID=A0A4Z0WD47_9GAMM|nr:carboxymuconolactone decarboxylase family protein [Natronospirillum operosum]TGG91704.1 carboxymuconolactone decarboxylase family protein [Natronospirillum operosum]
MTVRLDYLKHAAPEPLTALSGLSGYVHHSGLDPQLMQLVQLRASQLNGCAYCVEMHTLDLEALEEKPARLYLLPVWREADVYTEAERAALAWAEALTQLHVGQDLDADYQALTQHYSPQTILQLTFAIVAINGWNRLSVAFGRDTGTYQPGDLDGFLAQALARLRA